MTSRRCSNSARAAGSVIDSAKFVDVIPGEMIVTTLPLIATGPKLRADPRLS
jgi:hypothetical protein